jgi:hypothetical protein
MTNDQALDFIKTLKRLEIARLELMAIKNSACPTCGSKAGTLCQVGSRNGIGSFLPGYAHIARQMDWVVQADLLGESVMPAVLSPEEELYDLLGGDDELAGML